MLCCFASGCYGGHAKVKGIKTFGVKNRLRPGCSWGSDANTPLQSAPPEVLGLSFLAFKESAGSFNHKQVDDALHAALNGTLAATVPFSCCQWVLVLWLVELVTNTSKRLENNEKSTKNKLKLSSFVRKQQSIACKVQSNRQDSY